MAVLRRVLLFVALALLVASPAYADREPRGRREFHGFHGNATVMHPPPMVACRGILSACRNSTNALTCVKEKAAEKPDSFCSKFVGVITACEADAKKAPGCETVATFGDIRRCLRDLPKKDLSEECRSSIPHRRRRHHSRRHGRHSRHNNTAATPAEN